MNFETRQIESMSRSILKIFKWVGIVLITLLITLTVATYFYMKRDVFGESPSGARLERIKKSPNFKDGKFVNLTYTPSLTEGYSMAGVVYDKMVTDYPRLTPIDQIPSQKVDLLKLPIEQNILVWFGHSSYYIQLDRKRFLIDPVFSGNASPIPNTVLAFKGTERYKVEDFPEIDYLMISHDHYDHVDYETLIKLREKTKKVICGLGVGADFEAWGYPLAKILEKDWNETLDFGGGFFVHNHASKTFLWQRFYKE